MGILGAVLATVLLSALGLAIALLGIGESALAGRERTMRSLRHAAEAAAQLALVDLCAMTSWDAVLPAGGSSEVSAIRSRQADSHLSPVPPWGGPPIDLRAKTTSWQAASDAARGGADAVQTWRLFANAPFERVVGTSGGGPWYLAVWVADDAADADGDGDRDSNGAVAVRAAAFGPAGAVAALGLVLARAGGSCRVVSIRPGS